MSSRNPFVIRQAARVAVLHDHHAEQLGDDRHREEDRPEPDDLRGRRALPRPVDDLADDQWTREGAGRRAGDERAETDPTPSVGSQQRPEGAPMGVRGLRHAFSLPAPRGASRGGFRAACRRQAISAAPTMPASFVSAAGTISTPTSISGSHFSGRRLTPPPTMMRSGENRNTMRSR